VSYPICENWKDLIDENTVVIIDADQLCYVAAAANEDRSVCIRNIKTGEEFVCKNKTEFWGRKKTIIEGKLGDINILRSSEGLEQFTKDDFVITEIQTPSEPQFMYHNIKQKLLADLEYLGLTKYKCFLGGKSNPRLLLEAPLQYKSSRKDTLRPVMLQEGEIIL
jgi:predicted phosphohydrolase